jgi:hypothetical protein
MPGNDNAPLGVGGANQKLAGSGTLAPPSLPNAADIADAYVVVVSPYGNPRRRVYLSLSHATEAVRRAHRRGLPAHMVLCTMVPLPADLDGEGWSE